MTTHWTLTTGSGALLGHSCSPDPFPWADTLLSRSCPLSTAIIWKVQTSGAFRATLPTGTVAAILVPGPAQSARVATGHLDSPSVPRFGADDPTPDYA